MKFGGQRFLVWKQEVVVSTRSSFLNVDWWQCCSGVSSKTKPEDTRGGQELGSGQEGFLQPQKLHLLPPFTTLQLNLASVEKQRFLKRKCIYRGTIDTLVVHFVRERKTLIIFPHNKIIIIIIPDTRPSAWDRCKLSEASRLDWQMILCTRMDVYILTCVIGLCNIITMKNRK